MIYYEKYLLASLKDYMHGEATSLPLDVDTVRELVRLSKEQKLLPIIFLQNSVQLQAVLSPAEFLKLKSKVMVSVSTQLQRSAELGRVVSILESNGIKYIVFKGAVCRSMYQNSEYRTSSDEDILVGAENLEKVAQVLTAQGYEIIKNESGEVKLRHSVLNCIIELHSSLVDGSNSESLKKIGDELTAQLEKPISVETDCGTVKTFSPTYGFLSLCIHFFNHFVMGGIGIRPLMDIACFTKKYSAEIDFDYCFKTLRKVNADKLILTAMTICEMYFEVENIYGYNDFKLAQSLLADILDAGAYGTSDGGRQHSATVTKSLSGDKSSIASSFALALFRSKSAILKKHPELEGKPLKILKYRFRRIFDFLKNKDSLKTLRYTRQRKKLLKRLEIYGRKKEREVYAEGFGYNGDI